MANGVLQESCDQLQIGCKIETRILIRAWAALLSRCAYNKDFDWPLAITCNLQSVATFLQHPIRQLDMGTSVAYSPRVHMIPSLAGDVWRDVFSFTSDRPHSIEIPR